MARGFFVAAALMLAIGPCASAQKLGTFKECVLGKRVSTADGRKGTISRLDPDWSYCYVRFDDNGKETSFLHSLLSAEGGATNPGGSKLPAGVYECMVGGDHYAMDVRITGPATYSAEGATGKFRSEPSGKLVFESGPLQSFTSKILAEGRFGMNQNGGSFYNLACDLNRNKR